MNGVFISILHQIKNYFVVMVEIRGRLQKQKMVRWIYLFTPDGDKFNIGETGEYEKS